MLPLRRVLAVGALAACATAATTCGVAYYPRDVADFCFSVCADADVGVADPPPSPPPGRPGLASVFWADVNAKSQPVLTYTGTAGPGGFPVAVSLETVTLSVATTAPFQGGLSYNVSFPSGGFDYVCPPLNYNGLVYGCQVGNGTQMWALHRLAADAPSVGARRGDILRIDVILSGAPFPAVGTLQPNAPPFGVARMDFSAAPIPRRDAGLLVLQQASAQINNALCVPASASSQLSLQGLRYSGYGVFSNDAGRTQLPSNWHMDDARKLLVIEPYPSQYWFNGTGFFVTEGAGTGAQCGWMNACNYRCEVYNYDSRFLDHIGTFAVTSKNAINNGSAFPSPRQIDVFVGNAIDAAGVFPCVMYMDAVTGVYLGLDKLELRPDACPNTAFYWYDTVVLAPPVFGAKGANGTGVVPFPSLCAGTEEQWNP